MLQGRVVPYRLAGGDIVSPNTPFGSGPAWSNFRGLTRLEDLNSVDIVITSNTDLWTRVPVLEANDIDSIVGDVQKLDLRSAASVGKDDKSDGTGQGWGWFPGYAIDLERGIRLNLMFAEDSRQAGENGNDMIWNPTATIINNLGQVTFGGKHFLYVMGPEYLGDPAPYQGPNAQDNPYYGALLNPTPVNKRGIFQNCTWTMIPTVANGRSFLETDVTIKLRVSKEYEDLEIDNSNGPHPMYEFETSDMATIVSDQNTAENALSIVRVVPNPYYAYSAYENTSFERRVKITNLPQRCVISIYSAKARSSNASKRITLGPFRSGTS